MPKAKRQNEPERAPLIQHYAGGRAKIDPEYTQDLAAWLIAFAARYELTALMRVAGTSGRLRRIKQGQIDWAKCMLMAIQAIVDALVDSVRMDDYLAARDMITRSMSAVVTEEEARCLSHPNSNR